MKPIEKRPADESLLRKTAVRIVKDRPGMFGLPDISFDADFYCLPVDDSKYCYETETEFVFYVVHLLLVDACLVTGTFHEDARWRPAAILCEGQRLAIHTENGEVRFTFEVSGLTGKTRTLYIHTILREPGLTLRVEQNDKNRRAGDYRCEEEYPSVQIEAARHYEFAMREMLRMLEVPQHLSKEGLGYMLLLGFETNNEVHGDYPPHWHLIFRWPNFCGSQAPHIYLDEAGRITHNLMCIDRIPNVRHTYQPGEWCKLVDLYGRPVMQCRVNEDGGMSATCDGDHIYTMSAYQTEGIVISYNGQHLGTISTDNDTKSGLLWVYWKPRLGNGWTEKIHYDALTGSVLQQTIDETPAD